jgi:hypothetical protein
MWWNPWKRSNNETQPILDEYDYWVDHATADGSPWDEESPDGDLTNQSTPQS